MTDAAGTRCTAQLPNGRFCDADTMPGNPPFPICPRHMRKLYVWAADFIKHSHLERDEDAVRTVLEQLANQQQPVINEVVYYLQVGSLIKIGTTTNLVSRLRSYPPDAQLLATEPGGYDVEAKRLKRFNQELAHGQEWFSPSRRLIAHIEGLRTNAA